MTTAAISMSSKESLVLISWKTVCFFGLFIVSVLLVFYVYQVNYLTGGTYLINNYSKEIRTLSEENKNLEMSFAESSFLGSVLEKTQELGFQKTTAIKYIQLPDSLFALSK